MDGSYGKAYSVKRWSHKMQKWGACHLDFTAKFSTPDLARRSDIWEKRIEEGSPVILIEYDDRNDENPGKRIIDFYVPDGTTLPPTSRI